MRINQTARIYSSKFKSKFTVKKISGNHTADGFRESYINEEVIGIIVPASAGDLQVLPEEQRHLPTIAVYTEHGLEIGDLVIFSHEEYKVMSHQNWELYGYHNNIAVRHLSTTKPYTDGFEIT